MTEKPYAGFLEEGDIVPPSPDEDPDARRWIYVLTRPVTIHRDNLLLLEDESGEYVPAFNDKLSAAEFKERLGVPETGDLVVQAMHLLDAVSLAAQRGSSVMLLDGSGAVLESWTVRAPGDPAGEAGAKPE